MANSQLQGSYLLKIKTKQKQKLDSLLFQGENDHKAFKNWQVIRPESSAESSIVLPPNEKLFINLLIFSKSINDSSPKVF